MSRVDYYEFLQISPNAEQETIHRVYRFLGARYHPDNPQTGDPEKFNLLKTAYEALSDPERRAAYDASCLKEAPAGTPLCHSIDFMDAMEGETNRRLAVMAVLYFRRRLHPEMPDVSLAELETRMGFPRDYLDFTTWYLKKKNYISVGDNASFALTVQGVDYVETQRAHMPALQKLLTDGAALTSPPHSAIPIAERRLAVGDRRKPGEDRRKNTDEHPKIERRKVADERRSGARDRRARS